MIIEIPDEQPNKAASNDPYWSDESYTLYDHQKEGIELTVQKEGFLCSVGTGGGKRDIFQLGHLNRVFSEPENYKYHPFYALYPTYALLRQHTKEMKRRLSNTELSNKVGNITGKTGKFLHEIGEINKSENFFEPNIAIIGTFDKWAYLHYPSKVNKKYKAEFFYRQLHFSKIFDEIHLLHPYALQHIVLSLKREEIILSQFEDEIPHHSFFTATPPSYIEPVLRKNRLISGGVIEGSGKHQPLKIEVHEPSNSFSNHQEKLEDLIDESLKTRKSVIVILNSKRRAIMLHNEIEKSYKDVEILRVMSGINEFEQIENVERDKLLVIATSSAEAGVSHPFEVLITESCPSINLIQRIGRVGRYSENQAFVHILPDFIHGDDWFDYFNTIFSKTSYSGIKEFWQKLQEIDRNINGYNIPSMTSKLIFALHYQINTYYENQTLKNLNLNESMFQNQPYDNRTNYPSLKEIKQLHYKYHPLITKVLLNSMSIRSTTPNIEYSTPNFADPAQLALYTASSQLTQRSDGNYIIPGLTKPYSTIFTLGSIPKSYFNLIYSKKPYDIGIQVDTSSKEYDDWKSWLDQNQSEITRCKIKSEPAINKVQLLLSRFNYTVLNRKSPISYDGSDEKIGFTGYGLKFYMNECIDYISKVDNYLAKFPQYSYFDIFNNENPIIAIETSFGAAESIFNDIVNFENSL